MRIVSGKYRGKKLKEFNLETTRPTLDRVKESIFNLIQFDVTDSVVLDLFSGTGALGVEAVSRGASKVVFVDNNKQAIKIIKQNLEGIQGEYDIVESDFKSYLESSSLKFDIVLLDPPYATDYAEQAIDVLVEKQLLNKNAIIIFETSFGKDIQFNEKMFEIAQKKYGTVSVYKLTKRN